MRSQYRLILCDYINPKSDKSCELMRDGAILLKKDALGAYKIKNKGKAEELLKKWSNNKNVEIIDQKNQLALPGFYDMHFHWVQDDVRLMPKDSLLDWLANYTWPYEAKFKDKNYSKKRAEKFSKELLSVGTLGGAVYSSLHGHTVDHALKHFVGDFIVGNVLMTMNSPDYLSQTESNALNLVKMKSSRFKERYALTPRFAPTTSPRVMMEGGQISKKNKSFIQTHLSETPDEIEYVLSLYKNIKGFEKVKSYTEIYKKCGLLGSRTIMGHGVYLKPDELKSLANTKTTIAHCPTSNAPVKELGLGSGLFNFKRAERYGVRWTLASDIGGGPFLSMFDVMRSFVVQNRKAGEKGATYIKALYRSTLAGAEVLKLHKKSGNLDNGKYANFILVNSPKPKKSENAESILKKLIESKPLKRESYSSFVNQTIYKGKLVYSKF